MNSLEQKKASREKTRAKKANTLRMAAIAVCVLIAVVFLCVNFYRQTKAGAELDRQIRELEAQIEEQKQEKQHYDNLTKLYKTEEYQKLFAKERLGLVEENEKVFVDVAGE